ncbi:hypothetical protein IAR55_006657 [Kwoniella newhampshirensis]|uniref:Uncharacterized protein n=1 Tax=Kwoniella newhampshirensis TaxID=1651941 RepID=A0AAW0YXD5_9TREE
MTSNPAVTPPFRLFPSSRKNSTLTPPQIAHIARLRTSESPTLNVYIPVSSLDLPPSFSPSSIPSGRGDEDLNYSVHKPTSLLVNTYSSQFLESLRAASPSDRADDADHGDTSITGPQPKTNHEHNSTQAEISPMVTSWPSISDIPISPLSDCDSLLSNTVSPPPLTTADLAFPTVSGNASSVPSLDVKYNHLTVTEKGNGSILSIYEFLDGEHGKLSEGIMSDSDKMLGRSLDSKELVDVDDGRQGLKDVSQSLGDGTLVLRQTQDLKEESIYIPREVELQSPFVSSVSAVKPLPPLYTRSELSLTGRSAPHLQLSSSFSKFRVNRARLPLPPVVGHPTGSLAFRRQTGRMRDRLSTMMTIPSRKGQRDSNPREEDVAANEYTGSLRSDGNKAEERNGKGTRTASSIFHYRLGNQRDKVEERRPETAPVPYGKPFISANTLHTVLSKGSVRQSSSVCGNDHKSSSTSVMIAPAARKESADRSTWEGGGEPETEAETELSSGPGQTLVKAEVISVSTPSKMRGLFTSHLFRSPSISSPPSSKSGQLPEMSGLPLATQIGRTRSPNSLARFRSAIERRTQKEIDQKRIDAAEQDTHPASVSEAEDSRSRPIASTSRTCHVPNDDKTTPPSASDENPTLTNGVPTTPDKVGRIQPPSLGLGPLPKYREGDGGEALASPSSVRSMSSMLKLGPGVGVGLGGLEKIRDEEIEL